MRADVARDRLFVLRAGTVALAAGILANFAGPATAHGYCFRWSPLLLGIHATADAGIALAYFLIPMTFLYCLHGMPRDGRWPIVERLVGWCVLHETQPSEVTWFLRWFGVFILSCGLTTPIYATSGAVKMWTALVSLRTARQLMPVVNQAIEQAKHVA